MSQIAISQVEQQTQARTDWQRLCTLGGATLWVQLGLLLIGVLTGTLYGPEPTTAAAAFAGLQQDGLAGLLRLDWATAAMITLFPFVAVGLYAAFQRTRPAYGLLALLLIVSGTLLGIANHSAFSILYLNRLHAAAETAVAQQGLLAAGDALIAGNHWNGTAGFLAGLFMQGGFVFISYVMLSDKRFSRWTAYTGMLANGLDFIHVPLALVTPGVATALLYVGGLFYLPWFVLLGRDLIRLGRGSQGEERSG